MAVEGKKKNKKWFFKLRSKYRLIIMNEDTYEKRISFKITRLNVFIVMATTAIILIILTTYLIAFTSLREFIPGYMDVDLPRKVYELRLKADSIEREFIRKDLYIQNLKNIISGKEIVDKTEQHPDSSFNYDTIRLIRSKEDSLLRSEIESMDQYDLKFYESNIYFTNETSGTNLLFFSPLAGIITNEFNPGINHYGVDIVSDRNEAIKATLDGIVVFTGWTLETGYVIVLQHRDDIISIYKHNAVLLKKTGNFVRAGEPISIIGESGELSTGPHLHFELWNNGNPVNPRDFIIFN
jgi:murein DD-endopeptidase MepM/ murein hydrolase activator NlpD